MCAITVRRVDLDQSADGKSTFQILALAAGPGTELEITADGDDAQEAVDELVRLVQTHMTEG